MPELSVKSAKHVRSYILEIEFSDGHTSTVDFGPFIFSVNHPDYKKYKTEAHFLNFKIVEGNLNWDDYTMIFPVHDLYENKI